MNKRIAVVVVGLSGCGSKADVVATPEPEPQIVTNPPEATPAPPAAGALPTWDEAVATMTASTAGLSNPPIPALIVTGPAGRCYIEWTNPKSPSLGDRIAPMAWDAPDQIQCPPKAQELLDARPMSERIGMNPPATTK